MKVIKLHPLDNVLIVLEEFLAAENLDFEGHILVAGSTIGIGHKVAARPIEPGEKIIKYGLAIGSATSTIEMGAHVHLHNMKSDYLPTYTLEKGFKEKDI